MRIQRLFPVFIQDLQFIVEEYGIFAERRLPGRVDICEKTAFQFAACPGIQPSGLWSFDDDGSEKSVDIGPFFAASRIAHIVEQIYALPACIPGVRDLTPCRRIPVESDCRSVRRLYIVVHPQNMDRKIAVQRMRKMNHNSLSFAGPYDKRFYHLAGLRDLPGIISESLLADPPGVFFQYI